MKSHQRVLIELLAPPLLAAVALIGWSCKQETVASVLLGILPLVVFAYALGIVPSIVYTGAMEIWFRRGHRSRFGLFWTVLLSACLGAGAGVLSAVLGMPLGFTQADRVFLLKLGAVIGLLIAFYVGREQESKAQPSAAPDGGPATPLGNSNLSDGPPPVS